MEETITIELDTSSITLVRGDITRVSVDAIVNAANSSLMGGGGVDGAIHRAGGNTIIEECKQIVQLEGRLKPGGAVITGGGNLQANYVIHAVGPIWRGGTTNEDDTLKKAYLNSLKLATQYEVKSIAFPSISTGAYGFPVDRAAEIAIGAVKDYVKNNSLPKKIKFVLFDDLTFRSYKQCAS